MANSLSPALLGGHRGGGSSPHHHFLCHDIPILPAASPKSSHGITMNCGRSRTSYVGVFATQTDGTNSKRRGRAAPGVDTRIHWDNEDEGWVGGSTGTGTKDNPGNQSEKDQFEKAPNERAQEILGEKFSELINNSTDSHYQFLGVSAQADLEEIKSAYRRLSKEYHPDTTSLPLKAASDMFMKLRDVYDTLSDPEKRRFYDWTLAQEAASREAEKMRMELKDPYMQDIENFQSVPDMVDRLGGKNMELNDEAKSALTFDVFVIIFAICCIIYVVIFKVPDY